VSHPTKAVMLAARKAIGLWATNPSIALAYLLFPLLGLTLVGSRSEATVISAVLVINTLAVAATWLWEEDRFLVPTLGLLHYVGALGVWDVIRRGAARLPPCWHSRKLPIRQS